MPKFKPYRVTITVEMVTVDQYNGKELDYPTNITIQRKMGAATAAEVGTILTEVENISAKHIQEH